MADKVAEKHPLTEAEASLRLENGIKIEKACQVLAALCRQIELEASSGTIGVQLTCERGVIRQVRRLTNVAE